MILFGHLEAHTGVLVDLESLKEEIVKKIKLNLKYLPLS